MNHFFNAFCKVPFGQRHEVFSASYEGTLPNGKTTITGEVSGVKDFPRNYGYTFGAGHDIGRDTTVSGSVTKYFDGRPNTYSLGFSHKF